MEKQELVTMTVKVPKGMLAKLDKTWRKQSEYRDRSDYVRYVLRTALGMT